MIPSTAIITQGLQRKLGTPQFYMLLVFLDQIKNTLLLSIFGSWNLVLSVAFHNR